METASTKISSVLCEKCSLDADLLKSKYFITRIPEGKTPQEVGFLAERILRRLFEKEHYPTSRVLEFALNNLSEKQVERAIDNWTPQQLFDIYCFHEELTFETDTKFSHVPGVTEVLTLPEGKPTSEFRNHLEIHNILSPFEKQYWKQILDFVRVPTIYLTPQGPVSINYDKDRLSYLQFEGLKAPVVTEGIDAFDEFHEYIYNNMSVVERVLFVQHFA